jgi:ABC-type transporter MlaC component
MKIVINRLVWALLALSIFGCEGKQPVVEKGRDAVKEVVTQPFNQLDNAQESLKQSEDKQKAALDEAAKEFK